MGLALALKPDYGTAPGLLAMGQQWAPNCCTANIYKGGKLQEELSYSKFSRQSLNFYRCMGSEWVPPGAWPPGFPQGATVPAGTGQEDAMLRSNTNIFNGVGTNVLSFLDRGLAESNHASLAALTKVNLIGGITNAVEENWERD